MGVKSKEELIVYQNNDIVVWKANKALDCVAIAGNYNLPITKAGTKNLYSKYRFRYHSTFYFVRFKNATNKLNNHNHFINPLHFIVIDAQRNNKLCLGFTDQITVFIKYVTEQQLISKFPELIALVENNIIKNDAICS